MKKIIIFISLETYLRNWIEASAFLELDSNFEVLYVIPQYDWDPKQIEKYGILNYKVIYQDELRKSTFRKVLSITMARYAGRSEAFKIKLSFHSKITRIKYKLLSLNFIYHLYMILIKLKLGVWKEFDEIIGTFKPDLVIAPSLAADSFTIDMTYTANLRKVKSLILINSWDNLVSKGVIPIKPSFVALWGDQGLNQAIRVQKIKPSKLKVLGVPRFDIYTKDYLNSDIIYNINNIPLGKKIILYAATSLPFDDILILRLLNEEISNNAELSNYVVLFRPHPEMLWRKDETNVMNDNLKNIYIDKQLSDYYFSRFNSTTKDFPSFLNNSKLDYYPELLNSIIGIVAPATTLVLEGLMVGKPCLLICFSDGKNKILSPDQVARYDNVKDILSLEGVISCFDSVNFLNMFKSFIELCNNKENSGLIRKSTERIVYNDSLSYKDRLYKFVSEII
jgi:hypothetical protein